MRLLVTGAAGFIGRNTLLALPHSWHVVALFRPGNMSFLRFLEAHQLYHVQPVPCDLTNRRQVEQAIGEVGGNFDSCLALAASPLTSSIEHPVQDLTTNVIGLLHILQYCTFDHLVYLSSAMVYIGLKGLVGPESAVSPHVPYAISKLAAEHYIRSFVHHHQTPRRVTIVRLFNLYGPYATTLPGKLVRQFAFERNPHFTIIGDGENYLDTMYVDDAVRALQAVLALPPPEGVRCIDLGTGSSETVNQIVMRAAHTFELEPQISHEGWPAAYVRFVMDPKPLALAYGFTPMIPLEVGLRRLAHLEQEDKMGGIQDGAP
jgi:nucleoside-diphosphate-sugar epimerase